jgi:hypothetical protein
MNKPIGASHQGNKPSVMAVANGEDLAAQKKGKQNTYKHDYMNVENYAV